jgi:hypothetical protein
MNMTEMAKRMASRTQAEGQVLLGTVAIKRLRITVELLLLNGDNDKAGDGI